MCQYVSALGWNMVEPLNLSRISKSSDAWLLVTLTAAQGVHGYSLVLALWSEPYRHRIFLRSLISTGSKFIWKKNWLWGLARDDQNTIMVFRIGAFFCKDEVTKMSPQNSCVGYIIPRVQVKLAKTISLFTGQNYPWAHPSRSRGHFGHTALCLEKSEVQPLDPYFFQLSERYFAREVRFSCRALRCPSRKKVIFSSRSIFDKAEKKGRDFRSCRSDPQLEGLCGIPRCSTPLSLNFSFQAWKGAECLQAPQAFAFGDALLQSSARTLVSSKLNSKKIRTRL